MTCLKSMPSQLPCAVCWFCGLYWLCKSRFAHDCKKRAFGFLSYSVAKSRYNRGPRWALVHLPVLRTSFTPTPS